MSGLSATLAVLLLSPTELVVELEDGRFEIPRILSSMSAHDVSSAMISNQQIANEFCKRIGTAVSQELTLNALPPPDPNIQLTQTFTCVSVDHALAAKNEEPSEFKLRQAVSELAFDPMRFFDDWPRPRPLLTIRYLGDDYDFPVYSIALYKGCHADDPERDRSCLGRYEARMVRGRFDGEPKRPRWRGMKLVDDLRKGGAVDRASLAGLLTTDTVEWLQAELSSCAPALAKAKEIETQRFFAEAVIPEPNAPPFLIAHADTIQVRFAPNYLTTIEYDGLPKEGTPGGWANDFAKSLEDCWKLATATPPWQRSAPEEK